MVNKRKIQGRLNRKKLQRKPAMPRLVNHQDPIVSIIIPAMNERATLRNVLREAARLHPRSETIVVANGSTDGTAELAKKSGARVIRSAKPLGHDVGRRVGAEAARGSVLLFMDADMVIPAKELRPFVEAVLSGVDVALNGYSGPVASKKTHPVVLAKHVLNGLLSRTDLKGASLTAVPHALSRRGAETIGLETLEVPPLAQTKAVLLGLNVEAVHTVPVGKLNPVRARRRAKGKRVDPLTSLVVGDHLEAVHWLIRQKGARGGYGDLGRLRGKVRWME
ncbi:glycosyltransferase [Paenibacillus macerans]|uniref:glycosyltransferase family 2 protein n=1 Tax=Paenibacillus macerans TaxID=44252 RepID=UPI00203CAE7E|nr:glycosyltransferase [Paenibacillus macerans]MCM3700473.1 glycosyltransferase [Paenibacillus macerans]